MIKTFTFIFFLLFSISVLPQSAFDKALGDITTDISEKLKVIDKKKIVVLYITDIDKQITSAGKYLADVISVNLVNNPGSFLVFDRNNLNEIVEAKKLVSEGYIDVSKAQELKRILGVDVIVIGNYTVLSNTIKLTLKALDSDNGFVIAASMRDLPLNADAGALLGITIITNEQNNNSNRGYNSASGEITGKTSKNKNCKEKNIGDYCFQNNSEYELIVILSNTHNSNLNYYNQKISIQSGQKQCFYDLQAGSYSYWIGHANDISTYKPPGYKQTYRVQEGNVYVESCQEKQFIIR